MSKVNLAPPTFRQTFRQLMDHAGTTFGVAATLCIPIAFLGVYTAVRPGIASSFIELLVGGAIGVWLSYAATVAAGRYVAGEDPGVAGLLKLSVSYGLVRFFFTALVFNILLGIAALAALTPFFMTALSVGPGRILTGRISEEEIFQLFIGGLLSLPLLAALSIFLYLRFGLAQTASALEGTGPLASLGRSWQRTRGRVFDFFLLNLMMLGVVMVVSLALAGPAGVVSLPALPDPGTDPFGSLQFPMGETVPLGPAAAMVVGVSGFLVAMLLTPFTAALLANFLLLVQNPPQARPARDDRSRMVPLRQPSGEAGSGEAGNEAPVPPSGPPGDAPVPPRDGAPLQWPPPDRPDPPGPDKSA